MFRSGWVVPQPHPFVAEPVCMRMVQFQGKFKGVSVSTEFDQTGVYHGIGLLLTLILPRHIVICNWNIKKFSFWSQAT